MSDKTQKLFDIALEGIASEMDTVFEEGILDRIRIRARTLGANVNHKLGKVGNKFGVFGSDRETNSNNIDAVYWDAISEEIDKIYKPKFKKVIYKYFKDSSKLLGGVIEDNATSKKLIKRFENQEFVDNMYKNIKDTMKQVLVDEANKL